MFRGELGFLNCDGICMCVMNKQFELPSLFLIPFMLTYNMMRFLSLLLLSPCACVVSLVIFGLSVRLSWYPMWMRWLVFVLHVCMLRECEGARMVEMLVLVTKEVWLW